MRCVEVTALHPIDGTTNLAKCMPNGISLIAAAASAVFRSLASAAVKSFAAFSVAARTASLAPGAKPPRRIRWWNVRQRSIALAAAALGAGLTLEALELAHLLLDVDPLHESARDIAVRARLAENDYPGAIRELREYEEAARHRPRALGTASDLPAAVHPVRPTTAHSGVGPTGAPSSGSAPAYVEGCCARRTATRSPTVRVETKWREAWTDSP